MTQESQDSESAPKVFISYRWSSPQHEDWVLRLAVSLRAGGVDARLDKWDLKEGQDTLAFMESMVSDPKIRKVLLVCDSGYVERANSREGGVGTEAQIISPQVYNDAGQDKFAAIVVELDDLGKPLLPTYMKTRLYFDMSSPDAEASNFEKIVRWIYDEPFHAVPPIGPKPDFLAKTYLTGSPLFTVSPDSDSHRNVSLLGSSPEEVLDSIAEEAQSFLQLIKSEKPADEVIENIKSTRPVAENAYRALRQLVRRSAPNTADVIHLFFEKLLRSWDYAPLNVSYSRWDRDAYHFFAHDLLVSFVAIAMEQRSFELAGQILAMPFFKPKAHDATGEAADYTDFRPYAESLDTHGKSLRRISLHADLLNEAHEHSVVSTTSFLEADLTLHLRGLLVPKLSWYPISALYLTHTYGALPTYVRARSIQFYNRLRHLLFDHNADAIRRCLADLMSSGKPLRFDYRDLDITRLIAAPDLATNA